MFAVVLLQSAFRIGFLKLTLEPRVDHIPDREDAKEQISVALLAVLRREKSLLGFDQTFPFKEGNVFCNGVPAHADRCADGVAARIAGVRLPILTADQERVHQNFTAGQTEVEDFVRQDELTAETGLCFCQSDTSILILGIVRDAGCVFSAYPFRKKCGTVELSNRTRVCELISWNFRGTECGTGRDDDSSTFAR